MKSKDEITPKERMLAILQGKEVDRLLVSPLILNFASRSLNLSVRDFCTNGENMGNANIACFKKYRHDIVYIFSTTSTLALQLDNFSLDKISYNQNIRWLLI